MSFVGIRTQFFDKKKWNIDQLSKSPFTKNSVGRSASILAPAAFWKASHLNPTAKFSTLLSNRPNCCERQRIDNWWASLTLADTAAKFSSVHTVRELVGVLMSNNVNLVWNLITVVRIAASVDRINWPYNGSSARWTFLTEHAFWYQNSMICKRCSTKLKRQLFKPLLPKR